MILSQTQNGLKLINAIAGAGFDIGTDVGKKLSVRFVLELAGDFILAFDKAQRPFAEIVCRWDAEIIEPRGVVLPVVPESDLQVVLELSKIAAAVPEILFVS